MHDASQVMTTNDIITESSAATAVQQPSLLTLSRADIAPTSPMRLSMVTYVSPIKFDVARGFADEHRDLVRLTNKWPRAGIQG